MASLRSLIAFVAVFGLSTALPTGYGSYEAPAPTLGLEQPAQPIPIEPTASYNEIPTGPVFDETTTASYGPVTVEEIFDAPLTTAASSYEIVPTTEKALDELIDSYGATSTLALDATTTTSYGPASTSALDVPTTTASPSYTEAPTTTAGYQTVSTIALDVPTSTAGYSQFVESTTAAYQPAPTFAQDEPTTTAAAYGQTIALDVLTTTAAPAYTESYTQKALDEPSTTAAYQTVTIAQDTPTTTTAAGYEVKSSYEAPATTIETLTTALPAQDAVKSDYSSYQPVPTIAQDEPTTTTAGPYAPQPTSAKTVGYVLNHDAARAYWATATFPTTTSTASLPSALLPTAAPPAQDAVSSSPYASTQPVIKSGY